MDTHTHTLIHTDAQICKNTQQCEKEANSIVKKNYKISFFFCLHQTQINIGLLQFKYTYIKLYVRAVQANRNSAIMPDTTNTHEHRHTHTHTNIAYYYYNSYYKRI